MSPSTIPQIHPLPPPKASIPRGISIHQAIISPSLHRRQQPFRSFSTRYPLAGARGLTTVGPVSCSLGSSAKASTASEDFVRKTVGSGGVVVFSKSYCPYCAQVKSILKKTNKDFSVIELDERGDGQDIQDALGNLVGRRTVPQVFIKGEHIGGCDDTVAAYQSGKLEKLLTEI